MLIYVTGTSGTGKSAVCAELTTRGYDARDADEGIGGWFRADGVEVPWPTLEEYRTPEWYAETQWRYSVDRAIRFVSEIGDGVGFLCGVAQNENEIWPLIDKSFFLDLDEMTLRQRLAARTSNDYGKTDHELQSILQWHANMAANAERFGMQRLDGARPVEEIADDLLGRCGLAERAAGRTPQ